MSVDNVPNLEPSRTTSGLKKIVAASMVGTVVEWYEFFLYATAATLVFGKFFFPGRGNELDGIIAAFITYAVGFVARPLGGIVFGQIGDKLGRKHALQFSHRDRRRRHVPDGLPPRLHGRSATGRRQCWWRCASSRASRVGGEWGGAVLLVAEHSPNKSRGFWSVWPQAAVPVGNLLATLVLFVMSIDPRGRSVPRLGLARGVLALRGDRVRRLLHPHPRHRGADLPRGRRHRWRSQGQSLRRIRSRPQVPQGHPSPPWACASPRTSCTTSW